MTSLDLAKQASQTSAVEKNKKKAKKELSYVEAIDAIQKYDVAIKDAAKHRQWNDVDAEEDICAFSANKMLATTAGSAAFIGIGMVAGVFQPDAFLVTLGLGISIIPNIIFTSVARFVSPFKYKALVAEEATNQKLSDLKEEEFKATEEIILKKAKKARKVVDANLLSQNKYSKYHSGRGFTISEIDYENDWEKEKARVLNITNSLAPSDDLGRVIEAPESRKALTS